MDHEQVHLLARSASFLAPCPNASAAPMVKGIRIPHMYYCDPLGGADPYSGKVVQPTTVIDVTRQHDKKLAMLACHASQRDWLRRIMVWMNISMQPAGTMRCAAS